MTQETKIEVAGLSFRYGAHLALKNVSLKIPSRRVTALIGPSGCGKSTLLRTFNRIFEMYADQKVEGQVTLDGRSIFAPYHDIYTLRSRVGMVFQKPTPFPMSVFDNVAFGIRIFEALSRAELEERVEWALQKAAIWDEVKDKLKRSGESLSGGQQQRLCIARAIAVKPEVLLLDEPASALDPISTGKIEDLIRELKHEYTIVMVTHNMQQAVRISDITAFMYLGELVECNSTRNLFTEPTHPLTRDYVSGHFG